MSIPKTTELFDLSHTLARNLLSELEYPFLSLPYLKEYVINTGKRLGSSEFYSPEENVFISRTAKISQGARICGPAIICSGAEIRHGAFIRGSAIIGEGAVIGNASEIKNSIIFDGAKLPHYNYAGDSIIGYRAHLGAGAIASNFKLDHSEIAFIDAEGKTASGLKKLGAMIGDFAEIGCNTVLLPGAVIGRRSLVYPLSCIRGIIGADLIYKKDENIIEKR